MAARYQVLCSRYCDRTGFSGFLYRRNARTPYRSQRLPSRLVLHVWASRPDLDIPDRLDLDDVNRSLVTFSESKAARERRDPLGIKFDRAPSTGPFEERIDTRIGVRRGDWRDAPLASVVDECAAMYAVGEKSGTESNPFAREVLRTTHYVAQPRIKRLEIRPLRGWAGDITRASIIPGRWPHCSRWSRSKSGSVDGRYAPET